MAQAYVPIQTVTVGSGGSASIAFTNIPQNYTDLVVKLSARINNSMTSAYIYFNSDTTLANYTDKRLVGNGSTASSSGGSFPRIAISDGTDATASTFGNAEIYIPNYTGSSYKSVSTDYVAENNATLGYTGINAVLWSNTSAISSITIVSGGSESFVQYSTATLYGIGGARASGGTITADSRYTYHTFTSTGTFTALEKIKGAEVLCIAGGGGAGNGNGEGSGGGGAGGVLYVPYMNLTGGTSYTAVVGSGGTGVVYSSNSTKGSDSSFANAIANGGGASKSESFTVSSDRNGGSGGGGGGNSTGAGTATQGNIANGIGYGNNGGAGYNTNPYTGGGGGGAGAAGSAASSTVGGNGGIGTSIFSSWGYATSTGVLSGGVYYYAGGGGGGNLSGSGAASTGGAGGGGNGGKSTGATVNNQPTAGTANTGGGAGGGQNLSTYVNGGSGLVIIRYPN